MLYDGIVEGVYASVASVLPFNSELDFFDLVVAVNGETPGSETDVSLIKAHDGRPAHDPPQ